MQQEAGALMQGNEQGQEHDSVLEMVQDVQEQIQQEADALMQPSQRMQQSQRVLCNPG
eukprot:gene253-33463_t